MAKSPEAQRAPASRARQTRKGLSRAEQVMERRRSLIDAALAVIASQGLVGVTVDKIATQANCSYGVVAFHFDSKEGIVLAALDQLVEDYELLRQRAIGRNQSPEGRLLAMLATDFHESVASARRIAVWVSFWAEAARVASYRERCVQLKLRYDESVTADIRALAVKRGLKVNAAQTARSLNAMIDGFWIAMLVSGRSAASDRTAARNACLAFLRSTFPDDF